jgi:hypothetical protein
MIQPTHKRIRRLLIIGGKNKSLQIAGPQVPQMGLTIGEQQELMGLAAIHSSLRPSYLMRYPRCVRA